MTEQAHPREIIRVDNLVQTLGDQEILRGFSLKVHQGETLVLLGRSGGGKSVFLRHLIGLMQPISGTVTVGQEIISGLPERELAKVRRSMGMLFQNGALFDSLTVADNVAFPLRERGETDETVVAAKVANGRPRRARGQDAGQSQRRDAQKGRSGPRPRQSAALHALRRAHGRT